MSQDSQIIVNKRENSGTGSSRSLRKEKKVDSGPGQAVIDAFYFGYNNKNVLRCVSAAVATTLRHECAR